MGNADAQNNIGDCYYDEKGVSRDYKMALSYYSKAVQQGHADAQCNIGICFYYGDGISKNYDKALMWFQKAADQGNARGQYYLGECYLYGRGVSKDYSIAKKWYDKAVSQGNDDAMLSIGWLYDEGLGVNNDYKEAVKWYTKAADKGNANAIHNLATCYRYGNGVTKSTAKAKELYKKAIALNYKDAQSELNEMEREEKEALQKKKQAEENKAYIIKYYGKDQWALIEKIADGECTIFSKGIKKSLLENEFLSQMGAYLVYVRGSLYGDLYYVKKNGYTQMKIYFKNGRLVHWEY
ncbi:MAG: sel1 repeat family protein [Muribaculaceae bacterium]|nr:sel1 repeat family protein [Muribaculaceae bacterium]